MYNLITETKGHQFWSQHEHEKKLLSAIPASVPLFGEIRSLLTPHVNEQLQQSTAN